MIPRELFRTIRQLEIRTKGLVHNIFGGEYHSAFKGQGMTFNEVRPYQFGDDVRNIDWNVSARSGDTYVKVYEEEREQTVMLVVDVSGSEAFGSQRKRKRDIAAEICAVIAFSALRNNDKVGLLLFSDQLELFVPPKKGRRHALRLIRDLFAHEATSRHTCLEVALNHLLHVLLRRAIVVVLSDFMDAGYEQRLRAVARRHDTLAVHLLDPREVALPSVGLLELTDAETGHTHVLDTGSQAAREAFTAHAVRQQTETIDVLRRARIDRIPIRTDESYVEPLLRFFRQRNR